MLQEHIMANEGFLGKFSFGGERAATNDHPGVLLHLPLDEPVKTAIPVGTLMKAVDVTETTGEGESAVTTVTDVAYAPYLSTDSDAQPCAVVDAPCDPTGEHGEKSALCIVHGTAKTRLLKTGDGKPATFMQIAALAEHGIFAV